MQDSKKILMNVRLVSAYIIVLLVVKAIYDFEGIQPMHWFLFVLGDSMLVASFLLKPSVSSASILTMAMLLFAVLSFYMGPNAGSAICFGVSLYNLYLIHVKKEFG